MSASNGITRTIKRATVVVAVLGVVVSYGVAGPSPAFAAAAHLTGSSFEIDSDANLVVNDPSPAIDWLAGGAGSAMRSGVLVRNDQPSGSADDSFTGGTHENSATPTIAFGSIPPNKNDLTHFGVYVEKHSTANFVNVFWTRMPNPTGDVNFDFEFNQSKLTSNAPSGSPQIIPVRTPGDILISYDLQVGGNVPTLTRRTWSGSAWGSPMVFDPAQAIGSINSSAIAAAGSGGLGALDVRTFGEASLNLAALVPDQSTCITYGSVYVKSRSSGSSFDAELKDFIAPEPVSISNCGSVTIHKQDDLGHALSGAEFTLYKDNAPVGGSRDAGDTATSLTCTTDGNGDCTITDVPKGDYWAVETSTPTGHFTADDQQVTITVGDQVVPLTFVDPRKPNADLTVSKTATAAFGRNYQWTIQKDVDKTRVAINAGGTATFNYTVTVGSTSTDNTWTVTGKITVHNPNAVPFTGVDVTDAIDNNGAGTCTVQNGLGATVRANDKVVFDYSCTYPTAPSPMFGTNTATATWDKTAFLTPDASATGTATVDFSEVTPTTTNQTITVTDSNVQGPLGTVDAVTDPNPKEFTYSVDRQGVSGTCTDYDNTATITETGQTASKTVTVCVGAAVVTTASAQGTFDRTYNWTIAKDVDKTKVTQNNGQTATFNYTVTVTPNGVADSNYTMSGSVNVANPNDWEAVVADVTVTSDIGGGASCQAASGVSIPASSSVDVPYTCTFTGTPNPSGTNTATATTPDGSVPTTADVTLALAGQTNRTITVVDDKTDPGHPVTLGTATFDDGTKSFTYSLAKAGVDSVCTNYTNTAVISETSQSAQRVVTVCDTFTGGGGGVVVPPKLPFTGDYVGILSRYAAGLILAGLVLMAVSRRRRQA